MIGSLVVIAILAQTAARPAASEQTPVVSPTYPTRAPQTITARPPGEDWTVLFNGKDLSGWTNIGKEKWEVENGTLHGIAVTREYGYLQTAARPAASEQTPVVSPTYPTRAPQTITVRPPGEDWTVLFNGKDLSGWTNIGKEKWEVENGTLHGIAVTREYGYLQTDKSYKDFQLSLRFKCEGDGNSGVFFHVNFKPGTPQVTKGPQFEIDCALGRHTGGVYEQTRKWIVWPSPENESVVRPGEWNDYLIKVEGNHYISRLNGVLMVDYTDPQPESEDGPIALQLHSGGQGNMRFKDIIIRDLTKR